MMIATLVLESVADYANTEIIRALIGLALAMLVLVTARLGRPRRGASVAEYPPALGTRIILWLCQCVWILLIFAPLDLGMYWLAFLFALGPLWILWRWPATIAVDEVAIRATAPLCGLTRIHWSEVEAVTQSAAGDAVIVRSRSGEKIKVPASQVGAEELFEAIERHTGTKCKVHEASA